MKTEKKKLLPLLLVFASLLAVLSLMPDDRELKDTSGVVSTISNNY